MFGLSPELSTVMFIFGHVNGGLVWPYMHTFSAKNVCMQ